MCSVVGDFVPWTEISPLLDEVDMSVPKVPSISSGDFHAVESVCSAGVVQDIGEDVSIPTLSVPMSTSIPYEDVSCVQFDAALSKVQLGEHKAVFQAHADILTTRPGVFSGNLMLEIPLTSDIPIRRKMYDLPFVLQADASSTSLGAVLLQEFEDSLHPVCFVSRKLLDREKRYSTIECECLAIVWAVHKFVRFLWGVRFVLQTDHRPLTYLRTSNFKNSRIMRWALSIEEFSFEVLPVSGQANVFADVLSMSAVDQVIP